MKEVISMIKLTLSGTELYFSKGLEKSFITYSTRREALDSFFIIAEVLDERKMLANDSVILN